MIPRAKTGDVTNEDAIATMINFGTKQIDNLQKAWVTAVSGSTAGKPGNLDLQTTMTMIRQDVKINKRSKL